MRLVTPLSTLCLFSVACATPAAANHPASVSTPTFSYSAPPPSVAMPSVPPLRTGLVVRPDLALFPLGVISHAESCPEALEELEKASATLADRLKAETKGAATLRLRTLDVAELQGGTSGKSKSNAKDQRARADGAIEVMLPQEADYWTRMKLLVKVAETVTAVFPPGSDAKNPPSLHAVLGSATLRVQDPERYRETLTQTWSKRVKEFISIAQTPGPKLSLTYCEPPGEISQTPLSLEEISLQLPVICRLGVEGTGR